DLRVAPRLDDVEVAEELLDVPEDLLVLREEHVSAGDVVREPVDALAPDEAARLRLGLVDLDVGPLLVEEPADGQPRDSRPEDGDADTHSGDDPRSMTSARRPPARSPGPPPRAIESPRARD